MLNTNKGENDIFKYHILYFCCKIVNIRLLFMRKKSKKYHLIYIFSECTVVGRHNKPHCNANENNFWNYAKKALK